MHLPFTCAVSCSLSLVYCLGARVETYIKICWQVTCQQKPAGFYQHRCPSGRDHLYVFIPLKILYFHVIYLSAMCSILNVILSVALAARFL